jgi:hypothetical protein
MGSERGVEAKPVAAVKAFMRDAKWQPEVVEEAEDYCAYRVQFGNDVPVVGCLIEVFVDQEQLVTYLLYSPNAPGPRLAAVAEFVNRANYGMKIGNFEIDLDNGSVRYKSSMCFAGAELTKVLVYDTIMVALASAQPYSAAYLSVIQNDRAPQDAIADVEG